MFKRFFVYLKNYLVINLVKGVGLFYLYVFFNFINYKGCEIDVEMID